MKYFDSLPDMECLSGDTLPEFHISPKTGNFDGCGMELILSKEKSPATAVVCKKCTSDVDGFKVQLTSYDTENLIAGDYMLHFRMVDVKGLSHRKLVGRLHVIKAAKGES